MSRLAFHLFIALFFCLVLLSCKHKANEYPIGFYYWKTHVKLSSNEQVILDSLQSGPLAVRYFDLDIDAETGLVRPVAPVSFDSLHGLTMTEPVIFIKNRVFNQRNDSSILKWATQASEMIQQINLSNGLLPSKVIQLDCDWTTSTRDAFFFFIEKMKEANPGIEIISTDVL